MSAHSAVRLSRFTVMPESKRLTKVFQLADDGSLVKTTAAAMTRGRYERIEVADLNDLIGVLRNLKPSQALAYGTAAAEHAPVVCQQTEKGQRPEDAICRDRKHFDWPTGPGIFMLDYDPAPDTEPLTREALLATLALAVPALGEVTCVWMPSASSCIVNAKTGETLRGICGQRLYFVAERAADIPVLGERLEAALWMADRGYMAVSRAGSFLKRTIVDASVWQPERMDFAAGAHCIAPLERRAPEPLLISGRRERLRLDDLPALNQRELELKYQFARNQVREEQERVTARYLEARAEEEMATLKALPGESDAQRKARACQMVRRACEHSQLTADFRLQHVGGEMVTVADLLARPDHWHNERFADPIEPDYRDDGRIAVALLANPLRPVVYSHAHGGRWFELLRQSRTVQLGRGDLARNADECAEILASTGTVFLRGDEIVQLDGTRLRPLTEHELRYCLAHLANFRTRSDKRGWIPADPPLQLARMILDVRWSGRLQEVRAVLTVPTVLPDGRVIDEPGYDADTALLYVADGVDLPRVPREPGVAEVLDAAAFLYRPFRMFPFVDGISRAVLLSALLTAVVRAGLRTAPGFIFSAPSAGSGKTLLAQCVAALASVDPPAACPPWRDPAEAGKALLAHLREAPAAILLDNFVGKVEGEALCVALTTPDLGGRLLGATQMIKVPTNAIFLFTGNNLEPAGDATRRFLTCRIDPREESPHNREFRFNPLEMIVRDRSRYAVAACTVLRGFFAAGAPRQAGRLASFEDWSDLIRQTVLWLQGLRFAEHPDGVDLGDPVRSIDESQSIDPERNKLGGLLLALQDCFGAVAVTAGQMIDRARRGFSEEGDAESRLGEVLDEIAGEGTAINSRRLGRWLERNRERVVGGLRLHGQVDAHLKQFRWQAHGGPAERTP